jgi:hypothetical protein
MVFKEDLYEARENLKAWWDHDIRNRPVISYSYVRPEVVKYIPEDPWFLAKNFDSIEGHIKIFEEYSKQFVYGGERIPTLQLNYGPGIMASVLGVKPEFYKKTVWFQADIPLNEIVSVLEDIKLNQNNKWYERLVKVTKYAAEHSKGNYAVAMTDIGGVLDVLSSLIGAQKLIIAMKQNPGIIDTCRDIILDKMLILHDDLQKIIDSYDLGCTAWMGIWCPKHWYPIQCDFSAMMSPKLFKRFVLPDIKRQAQHLDYSIYHLDGPNELPHLDDFLSIPELTGIQWVPGITPGIPQNGDDMWIPLYKKIQQAGKNLVLDPPSHLVAKMYHILDTKGLFVTINFGSQINAEFGLPN